MFFSLTFYEIVRFEYFLRPPVACPACYRLSHLPPAKPVGRVPECRRCPGPTGAAAAAPPACRPTCRGRWWPWWAPGSSAPSRRCTWRSAARRCTCTSTGRTSVPWSMWPAGPSTSPCRCAASPPSTRPGWTSTSRRSTASP